MKLEPVLILESDQSVSKMQAVLGVSVHGPWSRVKLCSKNNQSIDEILILCCRFSSKSQYVCWCSSLSPLPLGISVTIDTQIAPMHYSASGPAHALHNTESYFSMWAATSVHTVLLLQKNYFACDSTQVIRRTLIVMVNLVRHAPKIACSNFK